MQSCSQELNKCKSPKGLALVYTIERHHHCGFLRLFGDVAATRAKQRRNLAQRIYRCVQTNPPLPARQHVSKVSMANESIGKLTSSGPSLNVSISHELTQTTFDLPVDLQHQIYAFVLIHEVFVMSRVSTEARRRVRQCLQKYAWDVVCREPYRRKIVCRLLAKLCEAKANIRSIVVDNEPHRVLFDAVQSRNTNVVRLLVKRLANVDVNARDRGGRTSLLKAAASGYIDIVKLLLEVPNVNVNAASMDGYTPLLVAAENPTCVGTDIAKALLAMPAIDVNCVTSSGSSPLHCAARAGSGCLATVTALLAMPNIDVNAVDIVGRMPIHYAAMQHDADIARALLEVPNVDVHTADYAGRTPCHEAAKSGQIDIIKRTNAVYINLVDCHRRTMLHEAAASGHCEIVKTLLRNPNIDVFVKDDQGCIAMDLALIHRHRDILKAIVDAPNANIDIKIRNVAAKMINRTCS